MTSLKATPLLPLLGLVLGLLAPSMALATELAAAAPHSSQGEGKTPLLPALPSSEGLHLSIGAHGGAMVVPTKSYDLVASENGLAQGGITLGLEPAEHLLLQLGLTAGGSSSSVFNSESAALAIYSAELTAGSRFELVGPLGLSARAGLVLDLAQLKLSPGNVELRQWSGGVGLLALGGVAFQVAIPSARHGQASKLAFTLGIESGFLWRVLPLSFDSLQEKIEKSPDVARIPTAPVSVGKMSLSGAVIRVNAGLRF